MSSASACGLAWPLGRTRAHAVSSLASRASRVLPHTRRTGSWRPGGLLRRPGWAVVSSEARHRRLRCVHRRRYAISNVADPRRGRRVVRADRSMFPKLCSYDNQDDLKQLRGRASRRDWAKCPVAFASGLSETSYGWSGSLEGFRRARGLGRFLLAGHCRLKRCVYRRRYAILDAIARRYVVSITDRWPWLEKLHACGRISPQTRQHSSYQQIARAQETHPSSRAENAPISPLATVGTA